MISPLLTCTFFAPPTAPCSPEGSMRAVVQTGVSPGCAKGEVTSKCSLLTSDYFLPVKSLSVCLLHPDQPLQAGADHHTVLLHFTLYQPPTLLHLSLLVAITTSRVSYFNTLCQLEEEHSRFEQHDVSRQQLDFSCSGSQVSGFICTEHRWKPGGKPEQALGLQK